MSLCITLLSPPTYLLPPSSHNQSAIQPVNTCQATYLIITLPFIFSASPSARKAAGHRPLRIGARGPAPRTPRPRASPCRARRRRDSTRSRARPRGPRPSPRAPWRSPCDAPSPWSSGTRCLRGCHRLACQLCIALLCIVRYPHARFPPGGCEMNPWDQARPDQKRCYRPRISRKYRSGENGKEGLLTHVPLPADGQVMGPG